jgi:DNA-binding CsgD family transcriptional regulator
MNIKLAFIVFISLYLSRINAQEKPHEYSKDSLIQKIESDLIDINQLTSLAKYPEAYDKTWNVLILSDSLNDPKIKYLAHKNLSLLHSIFLNKEKAIASIDSMFTYAKESGILQKPKEKASLYYTLALTYRMNNFYSKAKQNLRISEKTLDSLNSTFDQKLFVLTEKAHIYTLTGNYSASEKILVKIQRQISDDHDYSSIIYSMLGDLYKEKGQNRKALLYYNKCLKIISDKNIRIGIKVELLKKISELNNQLENYKLAYKQMTASKALGDSLFGSQSFRNKQLFEIKDSYRNSIIQNKRIQKEQEFQLVKSEKEKLNIQLIFSIILFVLTLITVFYGVRLIRKKHIIEKKLAAARALSEIEIKKKELAVTALQLIEKDKLLEEIKEGLDEVKSKKSFDSVEKIKSTIKVNSAKTWEEFETRFIQVNSSFYESLGEKHPNLSRNELKLCALIKLNFSTKEMSQLLGISPESVNKARYRLRKKMELNRDDNLVTYISSL